MLTCAPVAQSIKANATKNFNFTGANQGKFYDVYCATGAFVSNVLTVANFASGAPTLTDLATWATLQPAPRPEKMTVSPALMLNTAGAKLVAVAVMLWVIA